MFEKLKLLFRALKYRYSEDPYEINYLLRTIRKGDTVFDIGAHKGGYTFWMKKAVGKGKVIAFEPQPSGARLLKELFTSSVVDIEQKALSDAEGNHQLYIMPQLITVSFEASLENKYENAEVISTETTTLDIYCSEKQLKPSFIKIDVEGHEMQVLQGGRNIIAECKPVILIEIEERHIGKEKMQSIFSLLQNLNYNGYFFTKGVKTPLHEFDPAIHQAVENLQKDRKLYINNFVFEVSPG